MAAFRKIIHLDLDAFFCAVEEQRDPTLAGKPFAVGGNPAERGVVASCSYPARRHGVHSAMPMAQAVKLCPFLIVVPADHRRYAMVSRLVMARLRGLTPLVEQISIDEAFLDVTDLDASAVILAQELQTEMRTQLGLPCSLGVATNKLVAKIANNVGKAGARGDEPPNAIQVVPPGQEAAFLAPLPVEELWGVGPKTAERLRSLGMTTIGDIARWDERSLARLFGKPGSDLARRARGLDHRPVQTEHETKSVSQEVTFAKDVADGGELRRTLAALADGVAVRLHHEALAGNTVKLKLRWTDFTTPTRQLTLPQPTAAAERIHAAALQLFDKVWENGRPVRLLGVGISGLVQSARQFGLWEMDDPDFAQAEALSRKQARLQEVVRRLGEKYGADAVRRGGDRPADDADPH